MRYKFFLEIDGVETEVRPTNIDQITLKEEKEDEVVFSRRKLNGNITFGGRGRYNDWKLLYDIENSTDRCKEIGFIIKKDCNGLNEEWRGLISLNDGDFDVDRCKVEIKVLPNDQYRILFERWDKEYNILGTPRFGTFEIDGFLVIDPRNYEFKDFGNNDFILEPGWKQVFKVAENGIADAVNIAFREVAFTAITGDEPLRPFGNDWTFIENAGNRSKWVRTPQINDLISTNNDFTEIVFTKSGRPSPGSGWFRVLTFDAAPKNPLDMWWKPRLNDIQFLKARRLVHVIKILLDFTYPEISPTDPNEISEFFTNETNYVTNLPNELKNITVTDITDIKNPLASQPAEIHEVSLKDLLSDLKAYFNVDWDIIDGKFRLEHISFFEPIITKDLLSLYPENLNKLNKYSYQKFKIPKREEWTIANANSMDFVGIPIEYQSNCIDNEDSGNIKTHKVEKLTADLLSIMRNPNEYSDDALVLIMEGTPIKIPNEVGILSGERQPNAGVGIASILDKYHKYARPFDVGIMNGKEEAFFLIERHKKQVDITVPYCCDNFPFNEFYATQISQNGKLNSSEINFKNDSITLSILHSIYPDGQLIRGSQFDDSFDDSFS